ncbi:MAG: phosphotransferase family protein [Jatrophihabitans sp.]|uniref:phosphotransferase family protein n=1 Tax=Jatrophihabitans sp. TaxID=1932789 RepID=UPI003F7DF552
MAAPIDTVGLDDYLTEHLSGYVAPGRATLLKGGQSNPTVRLDAADGSVLVVRMRPQGVGDWAHAIDREYRVLGALAGTTVPVPRVHLYCDDESVIGARFYVMDFVDGRIVDDNGLPQLARADRRAAWEDYTRVFARLHRQDWQALGLDGFGRPQGFLRRQLRRHTDTYRGWGEEPLPDLDWLIAWLEDALPDDHDGPVGITHADIRTGNVVFDAVRPRVVGVLDWELSTIAPVWADAALLVLPFYADLGPIGDLTTVDLAAAGLPDRDEVLGWYCDERGEALPADFDLMVAFDLFRYSSVTYGVGVRGRRGLTPSPQAAAFGRSAARIAARARELIGSGKLAG